MARSPFSDRRYGAGQYDQSVTLQAEAGAEIASGLWARIVPLSGYERLQAAQMQSAIEYRATFPVAGVSIDATMRLVWHRVSGDTVLNIQTAITGTSEIVCDCVEAHA